MAHVVGIMALLAQKHPSWSPMALKSAIMTTAYQTTKTGPNPGRVFGKPFDFGAGHVDAPAASNPGVVFDSNLEDWQRFVCGAQQTQQSSCPVQCSSLSSISSACDPSNLNTPSVTIPKLYGQKTVVRILKSVLSEAATFSIRNITWPEGFKVVVSPASFTLNPGQSAVVNVTVTVLPKAVVYEVYKDGSITWASDKGTTTRIPVVVKAMPYSTPKSVVITPKRSPYTYSLTPGWQGTVSSILLGMQASTVYEGDVDDYEEYFKDDVTELEPIEIKLAPAQWQYVAMAIFQDELPPLSFFDMFLYDGVTGKRLAASTLWDKYNADMNLLSVVNPNTTKLMLYVRGDFVAEGTAFKVHVWRITQPGPGSSNAKSMPAAGKPAVTIGGIPTNVTLTFNDRLLRSKQKWLGIVRYAVRDTTNQGTAGTPAATQLGNEYNTIVVLG